MDKLVFLWSWTSRINTDSWIQLGSIFVSIVVAVLTATYFARKENNNTLKQNIEIKTYEEFWHAISNTNEALVSFAVFLEMCSGSLERIIYESPMFREQKPDADFRKRKEITKFNDEYNDKFGQVMKSWYKVHNLWEQTGPIVSDFNPAFKAYIAETEKIKSACLFPSDTRLHLDLENFDASLVDLKKENNKLSKLCLVLVVYGNDLLQLLQEEFVSKFFGNHPNTRYVDAKGGYQLTKEGLISIKKLKSERNKNYRK